MPPSARPAYSAVTWYCIRLVCLFCTSIPQSSPATGVGRKIGSSAAVHLREPSHSSRFLLPPANKAGKTKVTAKHDPPTTGQCPTTTAHTPAPLRQAGGGRARKRRGSGRNLPPKPKIRTAAQPHHPFIKKHTFTPMVSPSPLQSLGGTKLNPV